MEVWREGSVGGSGVIVFTAASGVGTVLRGMCVLRRGGIVLWFPEGGARCLGAE